MSVLDDVFGAVKNLSTLAPAAASWKELIDPVKATQTPTLGTATGTPIIPPSSGTISKTPGATSMSPAIWIGIGGLVLTLLIIMMERK